jgi:hypothetical protein
MLKPERITRGAAMADAKDIAKLKVDDFSAHLNSGFEIQMPGGKVLPVTLAGAASTEAEIPSDLKGTEGQALKARQGGGFTLQFVSPEESRLKQGTYPVKHPKLGTLEIFLVPSGLGPQGHGYSAVFA